MDMFTLEEFIDHCNTGSFIDYDGSGYYSDGLLVFHDKPCRPSNISTGVIDRKYSHVAWYNR